MATLSIYDAKELGLTQSDPLYQILYDAYTAHQELDERVARRAAELLRPGVQTHEAIWTAEREIKPINLINLTPHDINLFDGDKLIDTIEKSDKFARAKEEKRRVDYVNGWAVDQISYGEVVDLPETQENTYYIVSQITAVAAKELGRTDCLIVSDIVRNDKGQIIGCRGFAKV